MRITGIDTFKYWVDWCNWLFVRISTDEGLIETARVALYRAQEAAYRFMSAMAGDKSHFEDAIRALFANDPTRFEKLIAAWPADVRDHTHILAERAFQREPQERAS